MILDNFKMAPVLGVRLLAAAVALWSGCISMAASAGPFEKGDVIVVLGDSLTQHGVEPDGFVTLLGKSLQERHRELDLTMIGSGVGFDTLAKIRSRFDRNMADHRPDMIIILIGDNDVGKGPAGATQKEIFRMGLNDLVWRSRHIKAEPVLCTLTVLGEKEDGTNPYDTQLDEYSEIIRKVAEEKKCRLVELRKPLVKYVKEHNPENKPLGIITRDGAHLNALGNRLVADIMYQALTGEDRPGAVQQSASAQSSKPGPGVQP